MNYINASLTSLKWEEVFIAEALKLEERMISLDFASLNKSKLRIGLENNILNWDRYQNWLCTHSGFKSLHEKLDSEQLVYLSEQVIQTFQNFSHFDFWSEDLIPGMIWDNHLIVFGIAYSPDLAKIKNCIFVLANPLLLSSLYEKVSDAKTAHPTDFQELAISSDESHLEGIDLQTGLSKIKFNSQDLVPAKKEETSIWDYLSERHEEYSFEAKKQFNAYVVLKILNDETVVYKMDTELATQKLDEKLFEYSLNKSNPFSKVFLSSVSESFNISQLNSPILDYKYVCITALKRGHQVVGFLVGLKSNRLAETDQVLLEDLAKESA